MENLIIHNWARWQSYRSDRGQPPWIKLHREVMRHIEWVSLTDAQRGQLVAIWLLAADHDGVIPASSKIIQKLCHMDTEPDLNLFIKHGFIDSGANMTPECLQHDQPEKTRVEKIRVEKTRRACAISDDFLPTDEHFEIANKLGINLHEEILKFSDYHKAKGSTMKDWDAALRTWIRNAAAFAKKNTPFVIGSDKTKSTIDYLTGRNKNATNLLG